MLLANSIESTLRRIDQVAAKPEAIEVVVVDAGGTDGTMAVAAEVVACLASAGSKLQFNLGVKTTGGFGRGPTLSSGVNASTGSFLLFLHADTRLPWGFDEVVRQRLKDELVLATAFQFKVNRNGLEAATTTQAGQAGASSNNKKKTRKVAIVGLGVMEATVHLRSKYYQLPFGDQALGMTRQRFEAVGGFPLNAPIMEDFELVAKLRRISAGTKGRYFVETLEGCGPAECSSRRWEHMSVWRANLINQVIMLAYVYGGYSTHKIYDMYYHFNPSEGLRGWRETLEKSWHKSPLRGLVSSSLSKGSSQLRAETAPPSAGKPTPAAN